MNSGTMIDEKMFLCVDWTNRTRELESEPDQFFFG